MKFPFYKYQGCGNDFVLIDARREIPTWTSSEIALICHRRFGVGADGLMFLTTHNEFDFGMEYFNSDGQKSSFCGNGGRCIVAFAHFLGIVDSKARFLFDNKTFHATIEKDVVSLEMQGVSEIKKQGKDFILNTGSPHYIHFAENIDVIDLIPFAHKIRYSNDFPEGINVNLVEILHSNSLKIRTYERGVEDETFSCGTGVTAGVLAYQSLQNSTSFSTQVDTKGGQLMVSGMNQNGAFDRIVLQGPAKMVFRGEIEL